MLLARCKLQGAWRQAPPSAAALQRLARLRGSPSAPSAQLLRFHSLHGDGNSRPAVASRAPLFFPLHTLRLLPTPAHHVRVCDQQLRRFSSRRGPWQQHDWLATAKTGGLVLLGAGALVASTSLAFGLIITGAAGYGLYALYQKVFGPYRRGARYGDDPFAGVNANIDRLSEVLGRKQRASGSAEAVGARELDALVQGLPFVVRGLVKTIFSFVGSAMKSSMERAGELRRLTNERVQAHPRVVAQMGSGVSVSTPQQWMESTVNGVGRIEAVFPVNSSVPARVTVKASVGQGGAVNLQELKFRNLQTGEVIDLLHDGSAGPRKTVIDAEYVEI